MALSPVTAPPFIPVKPRIRIGDLTTGIDIECAAGELSVEVDQDDATTETFCGTYTTYKAEVWTIVVSVFPSYGAAGLWTLLRPLVGIVTPFSIVPDRASAISVSNPLMSGTAIVKAFPFYTGSPGEPTAFDVEIAVQGAPTFAITGTLMADEESATDESVDAPVDEMVSA